MPALAVALGAKAVIVENVPGIEHDSRSILEQSKALFESVGYHIDESVVKALDLGCRKPESDTFWSQAKRDDLGSMKL